MDIKIYQTMDELHSLADPWRILCKELCPVSFFSLPDWHTAWWESIGLDHEMRIITVYKERSLVGILPLCIRNAALEEGGGVLLEFSGGSQSDHHDLIVHPDLFHEVSKALSPVLEELRSEVDVVRLGNIPSTSLFAGWISETNHPYESVCPDPVLRINGDYGQLESQWKSSHRGDVRRQRRRLEKEGELVLGVVSDDTKASEMLDDFFIVYCKKWASEENSRVLKNPLLSGPLQAFYKKLLDRIGKEGGVHFSVLTLSGRPISYHFGFLYNGCLYWYRPTYDIEYQNYSPSKVHIAKLLELGCDEGWSEFDFLLGAEPYKYAWTDYERHVKSFVFSGKRTVRGSLGAWWLGSGKERISGYLRNLRSGRANGVTHPSQDRRQEPERD